MKPIVFIAGPTASGKSAWALELAKTFNGEIINADAMQVYEDLQILSARPTISEMQGVPHHLFGHIAGNIRYSTGQWVREVQPVILDCLAREVVPILVGGTGLYFKALLEGLAKVPAISQDVFESVETILENEGIASLREEALRVDPRATQRILGDDPQRLSRIVSVYRDTGRPLSVWQSETRPIIPKQFCQCAVLIPDRSALYERINARFENMITSGGLNEAKSVFAKNYDNSLPIMKAIGVRQLQGYFAGDTNLDDSIALASRDTRRFAKRQLTWFRGQARNWQNVTNNSDKVVFEGKLS